MDKFKMNAFLEFARGADAIFDKQVFNNPAWDKRTLSLFHDEVPMEIQEYAWEYLQKAEREIEKVAGQTVYPDLLGYAKWFGHHHQLPHADGEFEDGTQHPFHWRKFGCVYYLNDDYEGGEIYFPNQNIEMVPPPNTMVFFPGDTLHLHGVRHVTKGVRHTIASFWGYDKSKRIFIYDTRKNDSSIANP